MTRRTARGACLLLCRTGAWLPANISARPPCPPMLKGGAGAGRSSHPGGAAVAKIEFRGMEDFRQDFRGLDDARAGTVEELVAVGHRNATAPDSTQVLPLRSLRQPVHFG